MFVRKFPVEPQEFKMIQANYLPSGYCFTTQQFAPSYLIYLPVPIIDAHFTGNYPTVVSSRFVSIPQPQEMESFYYENTDNNKKQNQAERILLAIQECNLTQQKNRIEMSPKTSSVVYQNQFRNVMPNLIRLVLNFSLTKEKSQKLLTSRNFNLSSSQINEYYKYTKRIKTKYSIGSNSYISEKKLKQIFGLGQSQYFGNRSNRKRTSKQELNKQIIRKLSYFYLNNICVGTIISSKKIKKSLKKTHLAKRKRLISILRGQNEQ